MSTRLSSAFLATAMALSPAAQAAPRVTALATNVYANLYGITVDASGVYVTGSTGAIRSFAVAPASGVIGMIPLTGGTVTTLYSSTNYAGSGHVSPMQIASNGAGTLTWADPDAGPGTGASFFSGSTAGGAPNQFFGICCGPGVLPGDSIGVALSAGTLYFTDGTGGRAGYFAAGSTTPVQIGPTVYTPDFSTEAWAQTAVANKKMFLALSGQQRGDNGSAAAQVIDDESAVVTPSVGWIATNGVGGFHTLSTGIIPSPQGIVAVGKALYVTSGNTIWTVNQTTGATKVFLKSDKFLDLQGIAYYQGYLYVADSQNSYGPFVNGVATATKDLPGVVWKVKQ